MATPQEVADGLAVESAELDEQDIERWAGMPVDDEPEQADETATEPEPEPTSQQTKSQGKPDKAKPKPVNLDDYEEFRKFKAARDKERAELTKKLKDAEARAAQREAEQQQLAFSSLQRRMADSVDDTERAALVEQMAALRSQEYVSRERQWAKHVRDRADEEGLDPQEFDPTSYRGETGALQFERDLAAASKDRLKKDLEAAKKASSPEVIAKLIQQEVAKALRTKGVDAAVDTTVPSGAIATDDDAAWAKDLQAVQQGRMTEAQFKKKHPG